MKRRVISLVLAMILALGVAVPQAFAAGRAGDWSYEETGAGLRLVDYHGIQKELTLPDTLNGRSVVSVGAGCFRNKSVTKVTIPHGIRIIEEDAFFGCASLKRVYLGGSVNVIGDRAFAFTGLITVEIPGCVRTIGLEAFVGCESLYNVVFEEGVEDWDVDIGDSFGSGSVLMEEGVEFIGECAFFDCTNLSKMRLPRSVTTIGDRAIGYGVAGKQSTFQITGFSGSAAESYAKANGLQFAAVKPGSGLNGVCGESVSWSFAPESGKLTIEGSGRMYDYAAAECLPWYGYRDQITAVQIAEGITSVGDYALRGCAVKRIALPKTLVWIGAEAFASCKNLAELTFTGNAPVFAQNAFANTKLTAWYPHGNGTWTQEVRKNYGGSVEWKTQGGLPFVDVPVGSFYYDPVIWALSNGITTGTDATHFSPENDCQRAAVVTFLWRAMGKPEADAGAMSFEDVKPGEFFHPAVAWALEKNITTGTDATHFSPYTICNRAQVVTFLWRAMGRPEPKSYETPFKDVEAGSWYSAAVAWAVENGITNGMSADSFGVGVPCNRAQIVTFLYRTIVD